MIVVITVIEASQCNETLPSNLNNQTKFIVMEIGINTIKTLTCKYTMLNRNFFLSLHSHLQTSFYNAA